MKASNLLTSYAKNHEYVQKSLDIIEQALSRFGPKQLCISFNGGKDCTVVLHLVRSVIDKLYPEKLDYKLLAFYSRSPDNFEEEGKFIGKISDAYNLSLAQYSNSSLKESLREFKSDYPNMRGIFIGIRNDDFTPEGRMDFFAPTDKDWPGFVRVNPILEWSYNQVWSFIRELDIPYCDLYNQGYSSLGSKSNTKKNTSLLRYTSEGKEYYLPAWRLTENHKERLSRSSPNVPK